MKKALPLACLVFALFLSVSVQAQIDPNQGQVVAEVNGHNLTASDLEQKEGGKLLQARYQYYLNQRKALDDLVDNTLLELEARKKNLTVDQLLEREVYNNIKDPTEDQMQVYYEGLESQESYETVRQNVLDHIRELRRTKARVAYLAKLHTDARLMVFLSPPLATVDLAGAHVHGARNAPVMLVEFADYECPYCQRVAPDMQKLEKEYGEKISIVFKDFPLPMHHSAQKAAEAARCAGEQGKYWEMHDVLLYSKLISVADLKEHARVLKLDGDSFDKCLDGGAEAEAVKKDFEEGKTLGLTGTPSFFVNGHFFSGAADYKILRELVDQQLAAVQRHSAAQQASADQKQMRVGQ
jgi:protein-disulfide isomerase